MEARNQKARPTAGRWSLALTRKPRMGRIFLLRIF
jgi:hypothetical protein